MIIYKRFVSVFKFFHQHLLTFACETIIFESFWLWSVLENSILLLSRMKWQADHVQIYWRAPTQRRYSFETDIRENFLSVKFASNANFIYSSFSQNTIFRVYCRINTFYFIISNILRYKEFKLKYLI